MTLYLIGFPLIGGIVGVAFVYAMSLIGNEISSTSYEISVIALGGFGLFAGFIGAIKFRRIHLIAKKYEKH